MISQKSKEIFVLPIAAALVLLLDQVSKYLIMTNLGVGQSLDIVSWLAPIFSITHVTNTGAAFGLFPGLGDFFVIIALIVIVAIIIYYRNLPDGQGVVRVALGLQLGGAIGNLMDRLRMGFVVDFVDLNFWPLHNWPVFNLADSCIVAGVTLLALLMMWEEWQGRNEQQMSDGGLQRDKG